MVEVGAEESGVVPVEGRGEKVAAWLGAGFEDEDAWLRGGGSEVVRKEAAGCARLKVLV